MAWAKGPQPSEWSAKREYLKQHPHAICRRRRFNSDTVFYLYRHKQDEKAGKPLLVRFTAVEAWEAALRGEKY